MCFKENKSVLLVKLRCLWHSKFFFHKALTSDKYRLHEWKVNLGLYYVLSGLLILISYKQYFKAMTMDYTC